MTDTIDSLRNIYTIILALAVTEAFGQFARPTDCRGDSATCAGSPVHWDRLVGLVCILLLVVPFLQGMNRYLITIYGGDSPGPAPAWLLVDVSIFTIEAVLIFLMSRSLPWNRWRVFYLLIAILLLIDAAWGYMVHGVHDADTVGWATVNVFAGPVLLLLWLLCRKRERLGPTLCCLVVIVRTICDYYTSWDFYFPLGPTTRPTF